MQIITREFVKERTEDFLRRGGVIKVLPPQVVEGRESAYASRENGKKGPIIEPDWESPLRE